MTPALRHIVPVAISVVGDRGYRMQANSQVAVAVFASVLGSCYTDDYWIRSPDDAA